MHPAGLEPTISTSIKFLQGKKIQFELELIGYKLENKVNYINKEITCWETRTASVKT